MFTSDKHLFSIIIQHDLQNRNDGQGRHWGVSNKAKSKLLRAVREAKVIRKDLDPDTCLKDLGLTFGEPVNIVVTRILGSNQRKWDADSILRGDCKQLIDSIVSLGLLKDDGPKYVHNVLGQQDDHSRHLGPSVQVEFFRSTKEQEHE